VAPSEGATIEDAGLLGFLKDKLAAYKMPRRVMQMEALPRNATGKILKTKLREIAAEKYAR
jgi:acyl-coenzyme A synthetase/AMP-(fatty) acid ligase